MKQSFTKLLFGMTAITVGILLLLYSFGIFVKDISFNGWWPLILILPCLTSIIVNRIKLFNLVGLAIGCWFLLKAQHYVPAKVADFTFYAVILIVIGLFLLLGHRYKKVRWIADLKTSSVDTTDKPEYTTVFSDVAVTNNSVFLQSAELVSVFGKLDVDFSGASPAGDIAIEATSVFGSIEITVPRGVRVAVKGTPVFGGCSNNAPQETDPQLPMITISFTSIFGGIEIC